MSRPFKIGDIIILQHLTRIEMVMYNGEEGSIIKVIPAGYIYRDSITHQAMCTKESGFIVHVGDGTKVLVASFNMKHKEPPKEQMDWAIKSVRDMLNKIPVSSREPQLV